VIALYGIETGLTIKH